MTSATYDQDGNRATASFAAPGGTTSQAYVWDGNSLLMDSANAYIYADSQYTPVEQVNLSTECRHFPGQRLAGLDSRHGEQQRHADRNCQLRRVGQSADSWRAGCCPPPFSGYACWVHRS